jgi:hypothetical protein
MDRWAREMAANLKARLEEKKLKDAKLLETQRLKRELGGPLWEQVRIALNEHSSAVNAEMHKQLLTILQPTSTGTTIQADIDGLHHAMTVQFDPDKGLNWESESGAANGHWVLGIDEDGKASFYFSREPVTVDSIAKVILGALLNL